METVDSYDKSIMSKLPPPSFEELFQTYYKYLESHNSPDASLRAMAHLMRGWQAWVEYKLNPHLERAYEAVCMVDPLKPERILKRLEDLEKAQKFLLSILKDDLPAVKRQLPEGMAEKLYVLDDNLWEVWRMMAGEAPIQKDTDGMD